MSTPELIQEIIATYQRHGWELRRVLLRPETRYIIAFVGENSPDFAL